MIRFATQEMVPVLKNIWQVCFSEEQVYVDFVFRQLIRPENVLVYCDDMGEIQAMLCIQPAQLVMTGSIACKCAYIYGVATLPKARGKGLSTHLMDAAHKKLKKRGFALSMLVPAEQSLFDFYTSRGYDTGFSLNKARVLAAEIPLHGAECVLVPASLEQLEAERNAFWANSSAFVKWERDYLQVIDSECRLLNGQVLRVISGQNKGYAVCYQHGAVIMIKELAVAEDSIPDVLHALHQRYRAEQYLLYLRADIQTKFTNAVLPFSLVRWYDRKMRTNFDKKQGAPGYIAHVLD